jgi:phosphatidylglycerol:prolipoprotein diacylglycerol transferase
MIPLLIPYWAPKVVNIGPVPIDPWATLVLIGLVVGLEISRARGIKRGLEVPDIVDGAMFTVGMGFIVGHLMHVLAYNPERLETDGVMAWCGCGRASRLRAASSAR